MNKKPVPDYTHAATKFAVAGQQMTPFEFCGALGAMYLREFQDERGEEVAHELSTHWVRGILVGVLFATRLPEQAALWSAVADICDGRGGDSPFVQELLARVGRLYAAYRIGVAHNPVLQAEEVLRNTLLRDRAAPASRTSTGSRFCTSSCANRARWAAQRARAAAGEGEEAAG